MLRNIGVNGETCSKLELSKGTVCRCNSTFCDEIEEPPATINDDFIVVYTTSQSGKRLDMDIVNVPEQVSSSGSPITITLDGSTHQKMAGFGGAFTDSAAYVINGLPSAAQDKLLASYYSRTGGARYSMGRVPIGSSDFSRLSYSLVHTNGDLNLNDFSIQDDNEVPGQDYKLTLIQQALQKIASTKQANSSDSDDVNLLQIFASIWSAPLWMKTCKAPPAPSGTNSCGSGFIPWILGRPSTPTYLFGGLSATANIRSAYAQYFVKFIRAYLNQGVQLWGLTAQNEPSGNPTGNKWENTNFSPEDLANFVNNHLGPAIKAEFPNMKIMVGDDQYHAIPAHAKQASTSNYIDGVGFHWYNSMAGSLIGTGLLVGELIGGQVEVNNAVKKYNMNNQNGNKFILMTEACTGYVDNVVEPGSWERGYNYMTDILHEVESGSAGWVDWNLALDMTGGPNHAGNKVDSPILVNKDTGEFYKQPMYYAIAHFSRFVPPGAIRLGVANTNLGFIGPDLALEVVAFRTAANSERCVMIIANDHLTASLPARGFSASHTALIKLPTGKDILVEIGEHEFKTILFRCPIPEATEISLTSSNDDPNNNTTGIIVGISSVGLFAFASIGVFLFLKKRNAAITTLGTTTRPLAVSV